MGFRLQTATITGTSPSNASGVQVVGNTVISHAALKADAFHVVAKLAAGTTGTLDAVLQVKVDPDIDEWVDWVRFPQLTAGTSKNYSVNPALDNTIQPVAVCAAASPTFTLAANTCAGGHPGFGVRLIAAAGAGETTGATQTVRIVAWHRKMGGY